MGNQKNIKTADNNQQQPKQECNISWNYVNVYTSIIYLLPMFCILTYLLGLVFCEDSYVASLGVQISLSVLIIYFYTFYTDDSIHASIFILCGSLFLVFFVLSLTQTAVFNLYCMFLALAVLFELNLNKDCPLYLAVQKRRQSAFKYWKEKSELVAELGSQIHNQKKLLSLQSYFIKKEALAERLKAVTRELRPEDISNNQRFSAIQEEQVKEFQVYSSMLTFMSVEDLLFCYHRLNQYYRNQEQTFSIISKKIKNVKKWVLEHFNTDFSITLKEYKTKHHQLQHVNPSQQHGGENEYYLYLKNKRRATQQESSKCLNRINDSLNSLHNIVRKCLQNSQIIGLIVVAGWNFYGGVYTIPANVAVFGWAIVLESKTTVKFWSFLLLYSGSIFALKLSQLQHYPIMEFIFYIRPNNYFYQFIIVVMCSVQIVLLKWGGTSTIAYSQRENVYSAFFRTVLNQAANGVAHGQSFRKQYLALPQPSHSFIFRVLSKDRFKAGKDFYPMLMGVQLLILLYIFFFYDLMEFQAKNNRKSLGEILSVTQFSTNMMFMLFVQVLIMIFDRLIVSLNFVDARHQQLQHSLMQSAFKAEEKYKIQKQQKNKEPVQEPPPSCLSLLKLDPLLTLKYGFHLVLLLFVNFLVYFYIPSSSFQKSLIPQCQTVQCGKSYTFLSIFLALQLCYFVVSGLQVKHGLSREKCRNWLMEKQHWLNYYFYIGFTGLPFLWQFKKIFDWTTTATALPLFHWMKFQDIHARFFQSKCQTTLAGSKGVGHPAWNHCCGPFVVFCVLLLVISPLVLYSPLNPLAVPDRVIAASATLSLQLNHNKYTFFHSSRNAIIREIPSDSSSPFRPLFFEIQMSSLPDANFLLSQPMIQYLCQQLHDNQPSRLILTVSIVEEQSGESGEQILWGNKALSQMEMRQIRAMLLMEGKQTVIQRFYHQVLGKEPAYSIVLRNSNKGTYFQLYSQRNQEEKIYNQSKLEIEKKTLFTRHGVILHYQSQMKFKIRIGLLTFYITYAFLVLSLLRSYLNNRSNNIIYEGVNMKRALVLCEAVRSARRLQNFVEEECLYFQLVDLIRQPQRIHQMAGNFTQIRGGMPKRKFQY